MRAFSFICAAGNLIWIGIVLGVIIGRGPYSVWGERFFWLAAIFFVVGSIAFSR